jgi:hypothetical protein
MLGNDAWKGRLETTLARRRPPPIVRARDESMIRKSGHRFSEKIMLKQQAKAKYRINLKSFRFSRRGWAANAKWL